MLVIPSPEQIEEDLQEILESLEYTRNDIDIPFDIPVELIEVLLIIILVIVLLWIARMVIQKYSGSTSVLPPLAKEEEIEFVRKKDYVSLYKKGVNLGKKGEYTEAVRVLYMGILILLDVHSIIVYHPWVTNFEYRQYVKEYPFSDVFGKVTRIFDTVYYGGKTAFEKDFEQCVHVFTHIEGILS
ncbi:MAG: DUF4129 domain-containing protein [Candidatus Methanofastidiosia archaeon]|jgi:hypothetical protein